MKKIKTTFWNKNKILWDILFEHRDHEIEIATYGDWNDPADMCLECLTCNEVLLDAEIYTICVRKD